jgi:hypothetical protein
MESILLPYDGRFYEDSDYSKSTMEPNPMRAAAKRSAAPELRLTMFPCVYARSAQHEQKARIVQGNTDHGNGITS